MAKKESVAEKVGAEVVGVFFKDSAGNEIKVREYSAADESHNVVNKKGEEPVEMSFVKKAEAFAEKLSNRLQPSPGGKVTRTPHYVRKIR